MTQWLALPSLPAACLTVRVLWEAKAQRKLRGYHHWASHGAWSYLCSIHATQSLAWGGHWGTLLAEEVTVAVGPSASYSWRLLEAREPPVQTRVHSPPRDPGQIPFSDP